ncbi:MAG: DNA repair protein RecO [Chloroflexi bacterium]|nr:DNA repair protein RecO [Chloroflexota bacterium]
MPDRERTYRSEAVVLRHSDFGEADRLLTVYTPHLGKLRLLAKGVRKPTSRKAGHLESFTRTQLLVARGRNLDIITQAQMVEPYRGLRQDLWRMSHAYYVGELVDRFSEEQGENQPLYRLLCDVLGWVCTSANLAITMRFFELHLLGVVGYRPQLFQCLTCHAPIEPVVNFFSVEEGGALCPRCGEGRPGARPIGLGSLKVLRYLQTREYTDCVRLQLQAGTEAEVEDILQKYLVYLLERRLKSVEFLDMLRAQMSGAA